MHPSGEQGPIDTSGVCDIETNCESKVQIPHALTWENIFSFQDSSSGNVSEGENAQDTQEESFQGKPKAKEKSTPKKDGTKRSVPSKATGYKVEEKSP